MSQANPSEAQPLVVHLCDLRSGETSWSATVAVEGPAGSEGTALAIFYEGRRLTVSQLDEWGYAIVDLEDLPPPQNLTALTHFEVRTKRPSAAYSSKAFHPPVVNGALRGFLELHRAWPATLSLRGAQLQGAILSQADLTGVDFTGADLSGAKLWRAQLTGAIFKDANLSGVDLTEAEIVRADLQGAMLTDVTWSGANLKGSDLREASGVDLTLLSEWGHTVTTSEKQQARLKLLMIAQADPTSPHYTGVHALGGHRDFQTNSAPRSVEERSGETRPREIHSREAVSSTYRGARAHQDETNGVGYVSTSSHGVMSSYRSNMSAESRNHKEIKGQYVSGEHTFYRSPTQSERQQEVEAEETPAYYPRLSPEPELSLEERRAKHARERRRFERQLLKYQQNRTLRGGVSFKLNMVPHGEFIMGRDEGDIRERPRHKVYMSTPLLVAETLVTQELYALVMGDHKFKFSGAQLPAESVSWSAVIDFCNRLSRVEGLSPAYVSRAGGALEWNRESNGYRLPTEAEWEHFARARTDFIYAGSDTLDDVAWFKDNSEGQPQPVAQKEPNAWGLYDVSGNLWEWCFDTYQEDAYHTRDVETTSDPVVEGEGPKVIRGGSWSFEEEGLRVDHRSRLSAKFKTSRIGFRIVRSPKLKTQK